MDTSAHGGQPATRTSEPVPLAAPCRRLTLSAPFRWLRLGWRDLKRAPALSLGYGAVTVALSFAVSYLALEFGSYVLLLSLASGFILIGPVLAMGLYSISCQLERGMKPRLGYCLREEGRHFGNQMVFALILLVIFLVWARAASMVHIFFPMDAHPDWRALAMFLTIGSAVGSVFAALTFSASAFSLPMFMDRRVDVVTAVITSIHAVLNNKGAMAVWAAIILTAVMLGFATAFIGFAVLLPLIGHATWHAYKDTIQADAWPVHTDFNP